MKLSLTKTALTVGVLLSATQGYARLGYWQTFDNTTKYNFTINIARGLCIQGNFDNIQIPANKKTSVQSNLCCAFWFHIKGTGPGGKAIDVKFRPVDEFGTISFTPGTNSSRPFCMNLTMIIKEIDGKLYLVSPSGRRKVELA